jgi:4-amino-4-deoxy-L-arabinose transferase-like glycosyltransferase
MLRRALSHPRAPIVVGAALGIATTAAYLIGSGRSFGYDAAATFGNFVATPNLIDAFAVHSAMPTMPLKSIASNDHVFLSLISHGIYSLTGSRSEVVYRLVPALAAGGTVGVSAAVLARRFGLLAGACAGVFIATNPLFVENSRDLRGYSLAALLALLATILLLRYLSPSARWPGRGALIGYALLLGLAIATHVFVIVVLGGHVVWIAMRRSRGDIKSLLPAWVAALAIGVAANANIEFMELVQHGFPPSMFNPAFPLYLVLFLVGAPVVLPLGLWLSTAGLGLWAARREPRVWAAVAVVAVVVAILWLVLQPAYLYPRFFIFLIPGVAYLMAAAIKRWWVLAPVVVAGAIVAIVAQAPGYTEDPLALPQAARAVELARAGGGNPCVIHSDESVLAAYTAAFTVVTTADQLKGCSEVVIVSWNVDPTLRDLAAQQFLRLTVLPAYYHAVVLER